MNLFKLIDKNEEFSYLLNEKSLLKEVTRQGSKLNLLTYCVKKEKWNELNKIVDFVANHESKEELSDFLLNIERLRDISFYGNEQHIKTIINKLPLKKDQEDYFLKRISSAVFRGIFSDFNEAIKPVKINQPSTYEEIKALEDVIYYFDQCYEKIIEANFDFHLKVFKDFFKNYESYHDFVSLSNNDHNIDTLTSIVNKLDEMLFQVTTKEQLEQFINNELPNFVNSQYQSNENKDIFHAKNRRNIYLENNTSFNKLGHYRKVCHKFNECQDVELLIKEHFKDYYLNQRKDINVEELNKLLIEKQFKSIHVEKYADITKIVDTIRNGASHVERIYGLESEDVGGRQLSLTFTDQLSKQNGKAGLLPGGNLITYYRNGVDELAARHFVHEYSHYLQDNHYFLSNISYKESDNKRLKEDPYWQKIEMALNEVESSVDDVVKYSLNTIENKVNSLSHEQKNTITNSIINNINNKDYAEAINDFLEPLITKKSLIWNEEHYEINDNDISKDAFETMKEDLLLIHNAHHSSSFLKTIWKGLDDRVNLVYFSNNFEIHSRLTEKLTQISTNKDDLIWFPTEKMMEKIKPHLDKFNKMLSEQYNDFVLTKTLNKESSWEKKWGNFEFNDELYYPKIADKEKTISAISRIRDKIYKPEESKNNRNDLN